MEYIKQNVKINVEYYAGRTDQELVQLEAAWKNQEEASQKGLNKATVALEVIRSIQDSRRKELQTRLEELKSINQ